MDWQILGISVFVLACSILIIWKADRITLFSGVLGLVEMLFFGGRQFNGIRRVGNTLFGLVGVLLSLVLLYVGMKGPANVEPSATATGTASPAAATSPAPAAAPSH